MNFFAKLKNRKGITGIDVAAGITIIVLTVGIVTAIYINTLKKSKDSLRYANATRIATNIMENIQAKPYEYLTYFCNEVYVVNGGDNVKAFDTKIPRGYRVKVTAKVDAETDYDIARDVIINVTYKANSTYKTITLNGIKEKELMDMTNSPDITLLPNYTAKDNKTYYYPVIFEGTDYTVTTTSDIDWYDYEEGKYALIYKTTNGTINVGATGAINSIINDVYVWIPRFVSKEGTGKTAVQFLYGTSDYKITLNRYGGLISYGVSYTGRIEADSIPDLYDSEYSYTAFDSNDGLTGVWYDCGGTHAETEISRMAITELNSKIPIQNNAISIH